MTEDRPFEEGRATGAPLLTLFLATAALFIAAVPAWIPWLELDRALAWSQPWRLFTGHLTHFTFQHLALDVAALVGLGVACERRAPWRTRICLGLAALVISMGVLIGAPELTSYRGLSGLDSALFALAVVLLLQRETASVGRTPRTLVILLGCLFLAKLAYEIWAGRTVFVDSVQAGFAPVPLAHLMGALVGASLGALSRADREPRGIRGGVS